MDKYDEEIQLYIERLVEEKLKQADEKVKRAEDEARQAKEKSDRMEDIFRSFLKEVEGKYELSNQDIIDSLKLTDDTQIKYVCMLLD